MSRERAGAQANRIPPTSWNQVGPRRNTLRSCDAAPGTRRQFYSLPCTTHAKIIIMAETGRMTTDITREEFKQLEGRVDVLEHKGNRDKTIKSQILEQTRRNGDDLAAIKSCLDRVEAKLDGIDPTGLERKVDGLQRKIEDLAKNLPRIVADAVREVYRNGGGGRRKAG